MVEVIPAILPNSRQELDDKLVRIIDIVDVVQVDVMDGVFVSGMTWPYASGELPSLPTEFHFEVDLMVEKPEEKLDLWIRGAGAMRVIAHVEAVQDFDALRDAANSGGVELGLALGIESDNALVEPYLGRIDVLQLMGIATIGKQGEPFDARVLEKVRYFRERWPSGTISVDGGVGPDTAPALVAAGATRLVGGSAIFGSDNPAAVIELMQNIVV